MKIDLAHQFDQIELESTIGNFRADALLSSSVDPDLKLLIEFKVTHACPREKIESGHKIIEFEVCDEHAVEQLELGFCEIDEKCVAYNFDEFTTVFRDCDASCKKTILGNSQRKVSLNRSALGSVHDQEPVSLFQNVA